jgi:microcystin-dependent protein
MATSLKHRFQSAKANGTDNTLVQPSNWNDEHNLTCNGNSVLGNSTGANANVAEIPAGTLGISVLGANVLADLIAAGVPIATTGDVKLTLKTAADTGWIMCNDQTIGNTASGATYANANAQALYTLIWTNVGNAYAPVTGGRGASAAADWAAQKPLQLLSAMGRALGIAGAGTGLTARTLGQNLGEETHVLSAGEMPAHAHTGSIGYTGNQVAFPNGTAQTTFGTGSAGFTFDSRLSTSINQADFSVSLANTGGGTAHNNMQPTTFLNAMIKL